jgi:hypothetical protein
MPGLGLLFLQLAAAQTSAPAPDIELNARVNAREVTIRQEGRADIALHASTGEAPPVQVERSAPPGAKTYRNLTIAVHAEARLADPNQARSQQGTTNETSPP